MHVLYLIDSLVPGGAERSLLELAREYRCRDLDLDVAYLWDRPGLQAEFEAIGARLFCLSGPGGRVGWVRQMRRLALDLRPDLIHTTLADSNLVGRIAARLAGVPVVSSLVNVQYGPEHLSDPHVRAWRMRTLRLANALSAQFVVRFHAVTREVAREMAPRLHISTDRIEVIPRGRDPRKLGERTPLRTQLVRESLGIEQSRPLIIAVGRHEYQKRFDLLLEALPLVLQTNPAVLTLIAGREGSSTRFLSRRVSEFQLQEHVRFLGARNDVPDLICAADVLVLSSRREGFPGVLLEAMALETPIVATNLAGVREVTGSQVASLIDQEPQALAQAIRSTLDDLEAARQRARLGRLRFLNLFAVNKVADKMVKFYEMALANAEATRDVKL